jgi:hypothetical protein
VGLKGQIGRNLPERIASVRCSRGFSADRHKREETDRDPMTAARPEHGEPFDGAAPPTGDDEPPRFGGVTVDTAQRMRPGCGLMDRDEDHRHRNAVR